MNHFNHKIHNRVSENIYFLSIYSHITKHIAKVWYFKLVWNAILSWYLCFQDFLGVFSIQMPAELFIRHIQMGIYIADCCKDRSKKWSIGHLFMGWYEYQYGALHLSLIVFFTNSPKCRNGSIGNIFVEELHLSLILVLLGRCLYSTH